MHGAAPAHSNRAQVLRDAITLPYLTRGIANSTQHGMLHHGCPDALALRADSGSAVTEKQLAWLRGRPSPTCPSHSQTWRIWALLRTGRAAGHPHPCSPCH